MWCGLPTTVPSATRACGWLCADAVRSAETGRDGRFRFERVATVEGCTVRVEQDGVAPLDMPVDAASADRLVVRLPIRVTQKVEVVAPRPAPSPSLSITLTEAEFSRLAPTTAQLIEHARQLAGSPEAPAIYVDGLPGDDLATDHADRGDSRQRGSVLRRIRERRRSNHPHHHQGARTSVRGTDRKRGLCVRRAQRARSVSAFLLVRLQRRRQRPGAQGSAGLPSGRRRVAAHRRRADSRPASCRHAGCTRQHRHRAQRRFERWRGDLLCRRWERPRARWSARAARRAPTRASAG